MATVQILFVKENGIALLLEGDQLKEYLRIYINALKVLASSQGAVEQHKGKRINMEITPLLGELDKNQKKSPTNRIIIVQQDKQERIIYLLEGENFCLYRDNFFGGKAKSGKKDDYRKIVGKNVRVTIT